MQHSVKRSLELFEKAKRLIPGGVNLISRRPSLAAYGVSPIYAQRAKGYRIWDVDGNEYVDWAGAVGPNILGYADDVVDEAVRQQIAKGAIYSLVHELEIELAELLVRLIPSAEMVRYTKGGGEACAVAVRIARGVTGKDKVLFCGYHGWHDWYIAAGHDAGGLDDGVFPGIEPIGVPKALKGTAIPFPAGDLDKLEHLLKQHDNQIACIIMEPMRSDLPEPGYLEGVRELATRYDVILIFDEVSCGFRIALGGAQEYLGVTPDMTVLAKAISNGYPMGAVVGKRQFMEPAANMFISSLYWDDNIGLAAAVTTLKELERRDAPAHFRKLHAMLAEKINLAAHDTGLDAQYTGATSIPYIHFNVTDPDNAKKVSTLFTQENASRGLIMRGHFWFCRALDQNAIDVTEKVIRASFAVVQDGIANDRLDDLIQAQPQQNLFRRMVR